MSGSLNKVSLIGHLGRDPEIRQTQDGRKIANLSIATSEAWKDKNTGEKKERTEWHRVVLMNDGLATVAEKWLTKGSQVYIEGKLQTRKWKDQSGNDRYSTEVVLRGLQSVLTMLGGGSSQSKQDDHSRANVGPSSAQSGQDFGQYDGFHDQLDDEIAF